MKLKLKGNIWHPSSCSSNLLLKSPWLAKNACNCSITLELLSAIWLPSYLLDVLVDHKLARRETISVVEVLVDLVVVLQVLESLERLFGFSTMKRCFDLLGISLAMDFEMKSEELSFLKLKHNSSSRHGRLLTTLKIILILNWSIQFSGWIPPVSVQSDLLYCKQMHSISSADQRAQVHHHRKKIIGSVYISLHIHG